MISKSILDDLKERISIVSFIGERISLKKAGRNFKGLCPFHQEKTPSFIVSDDKRMFHCFGCGAGGDILRFVMDFEKIQFMEAVSYLAQLAGVSLPKDDYESAKDKERHEKRQHALKINELAKQFFGKQLKSSAGAGANAYLKKRHLSDAFFTQHFLGFADNNWETLTSYLESHGINMAIACDMGLIRQRSSGGYYDFFRDRVIFPIINPRNEVLGFGGRALSNDDDAKYINSPDSWLYNKSQCVYGLNTAFDGIRKTNQVIVVEGYMDCLAMQKHGFMQTIAPLGTALTDGQIKLLMRYSSNIVLLFDGDKAGRKAAMRALDVCMTVNVMPRVALLPSGEDPDSFLNAHDSDAMQVCLDNGKSLFEFYMEETLVRTGVDTVGKLEALSLLVPILRRFNTSAAQTVYRNALASRLDMSVADIAHTIMGEQTKSTKTTLLKKTVSTQQTKCVDQLLIEELLRSLDMVNAVYPALLPENFEHTLSQQIYGWIVSIWQEKKHVLLEDVLACVDDADLASYIRQTAMTADVIDDDEKQALINDYIAGIKNRPRKERLKALNEEIRQAEVCGNESQLLALLQEKQGLMSKCT